MTISNPLTATMLAPTLFQYCSNNDIMKRISGAKKNSVTNLTKLERQKTKLIKYMPNSNELLPNNLRLLKHDNKKFNAESVNDQKHSSKEIMGPVESEQMFHFKFRPSPDMNRIVGEKNDSSAIKLNSKISQKQHRIAQAEKSAELLESVIVFHQDSFMGKTGNSWLKTMQRNKLIKEKNTNELSINEINSFYLDSNSTIQLSTSSAKKTSFLPPIISSSINDKSQNFSEISKNEIIEDIKIKKKTILKSVNFKTELQVLDDPYSKKINSNKIFSSTSNPYSEIYAKCNPNLQNFHLNQNLIIERVN